MNIRVFLLIVAMLVGIAGVSAQFYGRGGYGRGGFGRGGYGGYGRGRGGYGRGRFYG